MPFGKDLEMRNHPGGPSMKSQDPYKRKAEGDSTMGLQKQRLEYCTFNLKIVTYCWLPSEAKGRQR